MHHIKVINISQKNFRYQSTLYKSIYLVVISETKCEFAAQRSLRRRLIHTINAGSEKKSFHIHNTAVETTFSI
jgi:hypothetical protein